MTGLSDSELAELEMGWEFNRGCTPEQVSIVFQELMRARLPALLAEVRRLRAALERQTPVVEAAQAYLDAKIDVENGLTVYRTTTARLEAESRLRAALAGAED